MFVEPDLLRRRTLLEEEQIGADAGVRFEDAVRQSHDGVEVALLHQLFLEPCLYALAEERSVGKNDGRRPPGLSSRMIRARKRSAVSRVWNCFGKLRLDPVFLAAERRIGEDDVDSILIACS